MSSRLMTMKSDPSTPEESSAKRRKLSGSASRDHTPSDAKAFRAALAEEEERRFRALEKQGQELGETRWVLSFKDDQEHSQDGDRHHTLRVVQAGYASIDAPSPATATEDLEEGDEAWRAPTLGRRVFGKFTRAAEASNRASDDSDSSKPSDDDDDGGDQDGDLSDDDSGAKALIKASKAEASAAARAERKAKRKSDREEMNRMAEQRRSKTVKLNKLTSISGGGGSGMSPTMTCHSCGSKGHKAKDCPNSGKRGRKTST
ncbi:MAG: hypothetical protein M1838_000582 [Thelocarpon superellum]|nr:MAG: hypothetical protein M1838_000582 [Thelocarpon superellum]